MPVHDQPTRTDAPLPELAAGLEEVVVADCAGVAAALGFLAARQKALGAGRQAMALIAPQAWSQERGRWLARGLAQFGLDPKALLIVMPAREVQGLWALEEVLKSQTVRLAVAAIETASLTATRRLDLAARQAGVGAVLLKVRETTALTVARRRWQLEPLPSAPHPFDARAPGAPRWRAQLTRRRDGPLGCWDLEWQDETHCLSLVTGLAGDRVVPAVQAA